MSEDDQNMSHVLHFLVNIIEKMDSTNLGSYLSPDFELESNRCKMSYQEYQDHLNEAFKNLKSIHVKKPFADIFAKDDKVSARMRIVITNLQGKIDELDVHATFQFKESKIFRWWEVVYPDWQTL